MRLSVFGLGYVGCVTAGCLAREGHAIVGVDVNGQKVDQIRAGISPVGEPGLAELIAEQVGNGRIRVTTDVREAIDQSDLALVCVGTPSGRHGRLATDALESVARDIGGALAGRADPFSVVVRSTVLPGTTRRLVAPALRAQAKPEAAARVQIAVNPEFMREGSSIADFARPPLTLVGCADPVTTAIVRSLYASVTAPFIQTTIETAELAKYVSNAFHALKVSFSNEIGDVCEAFGIDPQELMEIFRSDRKLNVSDAYLRPGFAFGGSCLPKDLRALVQAAKSADVDLPILGSLLPANETRVARAVERVIETGKRRVGVVGLAFKPQTDDLRESPMVALVEALVGKGRDVRVLDGDVSPDRLVGANRRDVEKQLPHLATLMCETAEELVRHAEVLIIGNAGADALRVLEAADGQMVLDLTRGQVRVDTPTPVAAQV